MKPHLPIKLRAALLAALVAVSFTVYSPAWAAETGDTLTETKVYEHNEPWTDRITGSLTLDSYAEINISNNRVTNGGAIQIDSGKVVSITNSGKILFENNSSSGGAIYNKGGTLTFSNNGDITFSGNSSSSYGGAISNSGSLTFTGNGDITFSGNSCSSYGGAIYSYGSLTFTGNGDITFSGNSSSSDGGAIYSYGSLTFTGNDCVLFEKNYEKQDDSYRLRSIYSVRGSMYLAAKEGGYIAFKDSLYSAYNAGCFFNAYKDENGSLIPSYGEIIFTGESTEADLAEIMGSAPTEAQITESRTSYVLNATTLYGGTLTIREQAILQGDGLTVQTSATKGGTRVLLRDGTLSMKDKDIVFQSGTVLDAQGRSFLAGNVTMAADSTLQFTLGEASSPILTLTGTLVQEGNLLISLAGNTTAGTYTLLSIDNAFDKTNWTESSVFVTGGKLCRSFLG